MSDQQRWGGIYRGVCVDASDPEKRSRIHVLVPQTTGPKSPVTAWPCRRPGEASTVLPTPGQGVWVMYESGHPDKPVWVGVF